MSAMDLVREFHEKYGVPHPDKMVDTLDPATIALRRALIEEELDELERAVIEGDKAKILQEGSDLLYVVYGYLVTLGIPTAMGKEAFAEIHRANLSKLGDDGKPVRREDGKVLKGPNYRPPDLVPVLNKYYNIW